MEATGLGVATLVSTAPPVSSDSLSFSCLFASPTGAGGIRRRVKVQGRHAPSPGSTRATSGFDPQSPHSPMPDT